MRRRFAVARNLAAVLIAAFALSAGLWAQSSTTSLNGRITDPSGEAIPGAQIVLLNPATGQTRTASSDVQGLYNFSALAPGHYDLTVTHAGFATAVDHALDLLVNVPSTVNVAMKLASTTTTVEVTATAPLVNHTNASIGNALSQDQIKQLPIANRNVVNLLSLQPGVVYAGSKPDVATSLVDTRSGAVNGIRSDQSNVTLDGVDVNDQMNGFAFTSVLNVPPDSLQQFRITTADPNASSGHSAGAQVAMVTKSGTNNFHGSLYEYNRDTVFSANDTFLKAAQLESGEPNKAAPLIRNVYGFTFGGPFVHNKLFFFANYEGRQDRESQVETRTVPTASMRAGDMKYVDANGNVDTLTPAQIEQMGTADGVPQNIAGVDPAILQMLNTYPLPNSTAVGDGLNTSGFVFSSPIPAGYDTYIARIDYNLSPTETMFARGETENIKSDGAQQFPGQIPGSVNFNDSRGLIFGLTSIFTPNLINNFHYGFIRQGGANIGPADAPFVQTRNLDFPISTAYSSRFTVPVNDFTDSLTWTHGNHVFQFGTDIDLVRNAQTSLSGSFSDGSLNSGWLNGAGIANTGNAYDPGANGLPAVNANFANNYDFSMIDLLGAVTEYDASYNYTRTGTTLPQGSPISRNFAINNYGFYAEDQWHLTPSLVLTAGLNYSLQQPPYETHGLQVWPCISTATGTCTNQGLGDWFNKTAALAAKGLPARDAGEVAFELGGPVNHGPDLWKWEYSDVAPRVGLAWSPDLGNGWLATLLGHKNELSIRGGYDMLYEHFGAGIINTFNQNGSFGLSSQISSPPGILMADTPRFTCDTCLPTAIQPPAPPGGFPQMPAPSYGAIKWGLNSDLRTPYVHELDFSITRQIGSKQSLSVSYVGTFGRLLPMIEDLAMPADTVNPQTGQDYFSAADALSEAFDKGTPLSSIPNMSYWQYFFGSWAGLTQSQIQSADFASSQCAPGGPVSGPLSATQAVYALWSCYVKNETTGAIGMDMPASLNGWGLPAPLMGYGTWYHDQYGSLYSWNNVGTSNYNGLQATYQVRMGTNLQLQVNYTYSRAMDEESDAEREAQGAGSAPGSSENTPIINSWQPKQLYSLADFNQTNQLNFNWVWTLPFGRGQRFATSAGSWLNGVIGGWRFSGYYRDTTGFPTSVGNCFCFPTNWQDTGSAQLIAPIPGMQFTSNAVVQGAGVGPNVFTHPAAALASFTADLPGSGGTRNDIVGQGYFGIDTGLEKEFSLGESKSLGIGWEAFNLTNSVRYDILRASLSIDNANTFGNYSSTLTQPRFMQLYARLSF